MAAMIPQRAVAARRPGARPSPQGTASYVARELNRTQEGQQTTSFEIMTNAARRLAWRIRLDNIVYPVRPRWLNEKLLWLQMWRGRIASVDMIFDVETGTFVYQQEANYNSLMVPCSMKIRDVPARR